jgi:hypothetical protein
VGGVGEGRLDVPWGDARVRWRSEECLFALRVATARPTDRPVEGKLPIRHRARRGLGVTLFTIHQLSA